MIQDRVRDSNSKVGSSYGSYYKRKEKISQNPDYNSTIPKEDKQLYEYATGGSWVRISNTTIDPHTTDDVRVVDWKRGKISRFTKRSRRNLLSLVAKLDKSGVDPKDVLFITLTAPGQGWMELSGKKWKARLNNFLTQLRKEYKSIGLCGIWRMEFQERGAPHFHIVSYNVSYIDYSWIAERWNRICCSNLTDEKAIKDHYDAGTQIERAKYWGKVNSYFSKTMAYVAKDDSWKSQIEDEELREWMTNFGRHWGVICRDKLKEMIDIVVGEFDTDKQFYRVRRLVKQYIHSCKRKKLGANYNSKTAKMMNRLFSMKDKCKYTAFIPDDVFRKVLSWAGLNGSVADISGLVEV